MTRCCCCNPDVYGEADVTRGGVVSLVTIWGGYGDAYVSRSDGDAMAACEDGGVAIVSCRRVVEDGAATTHEEIESTIKVVDQGGWWQPVKELNQLQRLKW